MQNKNILISGAGIAGLTLAFWLKKFGFNPVIIERASGIPQGGYMIDFFGKGVDVAYKMGLRTELEKADAMIREIDFVDENNRKVGGFSTGSFKHLIKNPFHNLLRSELVNIIHALVKDDVQIVFNQSIVSLKQTEEAVEVQFKDQSIQHFDLVIGADGIHSKVRALAFGPEHEFEKFFGYYTSSFTIPDFIESDPRFLSYTVPGKQVSIYPIKDNKITAFFVFKPDRELEKNEPEYQKKYLKEVYKDMKWYTPQLLGKLNEAPDFYFDRVSQIQMQSWSNGRVSLAGDACDCPSLLSGQGSTLAMVGAYVLAGEMKEAGGDYRQAFRNYELIFKPFMDSKQKIAQDFSSSFVPPNQFSLWVRNKFSNLMFFPIVSKWVVRKFLSDNIELKDYETATN